MNDIQKDYDVDIYYYNYKDNNPKYEIKDKKLIKTADGTKLYSEMLDKLNEYINPLNMEKEDQIYKTEEKLFSTPAIVFIVDKTIYGYYDDFEFDSSNNSIKLAEQYQKLIIEGFKKITK